MDPSLVFDPKAVGAQTQFAPRPQPTVNTQTLGLDDNWSRIMQAAKAGLISPQQMEMLKKQLGYDQPQQGQQPSNIGGQIGQAAGDIVGRVGKSIYKGLQTNEPNPEQMIGKPGVNVEPMPKQGDVNGVVGGRGEWQPLPPSPQWNQ